MAVQLLGVGKRALHRLLAAAIDGLAPCCQPAGVVAHAGVLPDMAVDGAFAIAVRQASSGQFRQIEGLL
jgi:hypothetical protein